MLDSLFIYLDYDKSMFISPIIISFLRCHSNTDGEYSFLNYQLEITFGKISLFINGKNLYLLKNLINDILVKESEINNLCLEKNDFIGFNDPLLNLSLSSESNFSY